VDNRALPEYDYLIADEAHHLEDATTQQLSFSVNRNRMQRLLADIGKVSEGKRASGLLADLLGRVRHAVPDELVHPVESFVDQTFKAVDGLMRQSDDLFDQVAQFVESAKEDNGGEYSFKLRLIPAVRAQPAWSSIEVACDNLGKGLFAVADGLSRLGQALNDLDEYDPMPKICSRVSWGRAEKWQKCVNNSTRFCASPSHRAFTGSSCPQTITAGGAEATGCSHCTRLRCTSGRWSRSICSRPRNRW
jgi:hypothetical protein